MQIAGKDRRSDNQASLGGQHCSLLSQVQEHTQDADGHRESMGRPGIRPETTMKELTEYVSKEHIEATSSQVYTRQNLRF